MSSHRAWGQVVEKKKAEPKEKAEDKPKVS